MLTFREIHALNPYLSLLERLRPLFNEADAEIVRTVFDWSHARERLESARDALAAVKPAFEAERAEHERQSAIYHQRFMDAKDSPSLRAVANKHIRAHGEALEKMNLQKRLAVAERRVDYAKARLSAQSGVLIEIANNRQTARAKIVPLTIVDISDAFVRV